MQQRRLGQSGPVTSALGLGLMGMSDFYGTADEAESIATIHAALDAGVTLMDTGDFYGVGHNESLLGRALAQSSRLEQAIVSLKFGALRDPAGGFVGYDARPKSVKNFLAYSLQRLGLNHVDIYRPARLDPEVPIEDTIGAIAELQQAGYVRHIGLSEVGVETIRRAAATATISDLQIEYSLLSRGIEDAILPAARELGIGITAYGVLSRGLITGDWRRPAPGEFDFRAISPRFQEGNVERNLALAEALGRVAEARGISRAQAAIAWVAAQGNDIVPLIGARRRDRLAESLGALGVILSPDDLAAIEQAVLKGAAAGGRYPDQQLAFMDSER
ncbi:MAG: aldo/keto reductase [Porphyrobacter sp.]|jgi:aryl-alcohol dehydrogenase-like predicted oxidoreductase|nr:aldo/keto reductase [Porphyrobacter sp.]